MDFEYFKKQREKLKKLKADTLNKVFDEYLHDK